MRTRDFIPPIVWNFLKRFKPSGKLSGWFGDFANWETAKSHSTGYDTEEILARVKQASLDIVSGKAVYERDGIAYNKIQISFPLLASLLYIGSDLKNKINVLDFGGSLGSSYFQNRPFLNHLNLVKWHIVEQENFVSTGIRELETDELFFHYSVKDCLVKNNPDVMLISSTLEYLANPMEFLTYLISLNFKYIIFDRTIFSKTGMQRISVQHVKTPPYNAKIPCWIFEKKSFLSNFSPGYKLIYDWHTGWETQETCHLGFLFQKNKL